jgi:5-(carboxyamino)imidazole ribonucleotide synthase
MFSTDITLGILGGGQLGKMLLYDTRKWDIKTAVLDAAADAPARLACNEFVKGSLLDYETVLAFGKKCDIITIEIENVNTDALFELEKIGKKVYPQPAVLSIIQDKTVQKMFYKNNDIATAEFWIFDTKADFELALSQKIIAFPLVWKAPRFGYDGKGVKILRKQSDADDLPEGSMLIECCIAIQKELAVSVARNAAGETAAFPVVEMAFEDQANLVEIVGCPAQISVFDEVKATELAINIAERLNIVGILAVEMLLTTSGDLLVNEVAPRPHNSAHLFSDAAYTSQFEQHLRAILGLPFGNTALHTPAAMLNLVGAAGFSGAVVYENLQEAMALENVMPHIYGKRETRPFRKMGHINIGAPTLAKAYQKAKKVQKMVIVKSNV